jgi:aspartate aminotransferase-like enzyme
LCADPAANAYLDVFDRLQHVNSVGLLRAVVATRQGQLVDTPSVFHLLSTAKALEIFEEEGGREAVAGRHSELAGLVREGVRELGLRVMPSAPYESDSVTVGILPAGLDAGAIRKAVARNTGIAIAGAQGDYWKPRMLRIGTLGFTTHADVVRCLRALRQALAEAGYTPAPDARVVSAF